jgi:hypothetical protein
MSWSERAEGTSFGSDRVTGKSLAVGPNLVPTFPVQTGMKFLKIRWFFFHKYTHKNGNELSISTKREGFLCQLSHSRIAMLYSDCLGLLQRTLQDHKYRLELLVTRNHWVQIRTLNKRLEAVSVGDLIPFKYKQIFKRLKNNGLQTSNH